MDPLAQIKVYESVADFFTSNPDRLYRFWVYKHIFTPDEIDKKYIDQTPYEESRCRTGVIREVIPLPDGDLLIGFAEIYESLAELGADNRAMAYFRLSEIRINFLPMDGDTYAAED